MIDNARNQATTADPALLADLAAELGASTPDVPVRRWMQSPTAGHIAGLFWGGGAPELALLHDLGDSANGWDAVAVALQRPLVAIDLPGHGRSSGARSVPAPARAASAVLDGLWSHARHADTVVATGYGAAVALHAAARRPGNVRSLIVVDGGPLASGIFPTADRFPDGDAAAAELSAQAPLRGPAAVRWQVAETTRPHPEGGLAWRSQPDRPRGDEPWLRLEGLVDVGVPVGVVLANSGAPLDPIVSALLTRRPGAPVRRIDAHRDLLGSAPAALAAAISSLAAELAPRERVVTGTRAGAA